MGFDGWRIKAPGRRVAALLTEPFSKVARSIGRHERCRIKQGADVRRPPSGDELHEQVVVTAHRANDGLEATDAIEYGARIAEIAADRHVGPAEAGGAGRQESGDEGLVACQPSYEAATR